MIIFDPDVQAALSARAIRARDFLWIVPYDRVTRAPVPFGYWSDVSTLAGAEVVDPQTGGVVQRDFSGAGGLIAIDAVRATSGLDITSVSITVSHLERTSDMLRAYDPRHARVEIFRGLFDVAGYRLVAPAVARFVGRVETLEITTAAEGGYGQAVLDVSPLSYQLNHKNPATRSDAHLRLRSETDSARQHAAVVGTWQIWWGTREGSS